jgi:hypothetical protein
MTRIVADSIRLGTPIIAVSIQYRLNIFALGSKNGPPNLALRDQALALEWIQDHVTGFGGDPVRKKQPSFTRPLTISRKRLHWPEKVPARFTAMLIS